VPAHLPVNMYMMLSALNITIFHEFFLIFQDEIFHHASLPVTLFLFRCYQRISSGQAVEWNMEFRGKRQYKRYLTNPDIPVP